MRRVKVKAIRIEEVILLGALLVAGLCPVVRAESIRIKSIEVSDTGSGPDQSGTSIDVVQDICDYVDKTGDDDTDDPEDIELEDFFDSYIIATVVNDSDSNIEVKKFSYRVQKGQNNRAFVSKSLAPSVSGTILANSVGQVILLFLKNSERKKYFTRTSTEIDPALGFKNVTLRLQIRDGLGRKRVISGRTALSFGNFNRCD